MSFSLQKRNNTGESRSDDEVDDNNVFEEAASLDDPSPMIILFEDAVEGAPLVQTAPTEQGRALLAAISQVSIREDNPAGLTIFKVYLLTLCALLQAMVLLLTMHLFSDRHNKDEMYELRHVTFLSNIVKLGLACIMESIATQGNLLASLRLYVGQQPWDALRMLVPTVLYTIQDWLANMAVTHLSPRSFRFIQEMRIVVMALFSMKILKSSYTGKQWVCLFWVWIGMYLSTVDHALSKSFWPSTEEEEDGSGGSTSNSFLGYEAVVGSVLCFALGSVYFEHVVKSPLNERTGGVTASVWMRIIQLSTFSMIIHGIRSAQAAMNAPSSSSSSSYFAGFGPLVWTLVVGQGCASAVLAATINFTDNILKCLAIAVGSTLAAICYAGTWESESSGFVFLLGCVILSAGVWFYCMPLPAVCRRL